MKDSKEKMKKDSNSFKRPDITCNWRPNNNNKKKQKKYLKK